MAGDFLFGSALDLQDLRINGTPDISKLEKLTEFIPKIGLEQLLKNIIDYQRSKLSV